jgi:aminopeptidase N
MGEQLKVSSVYLDNEPVAFLHKNDSLFIISSLFSTSTHTIEIYYSGDASDNEDYGAMFTKNTDYGPVSYTLTEPFASKYWFPCKEVLSDKADSVYVYFTVLKSLKAGSNGLLKKVVDVDDTHHQFQWESKYPISYYLISVAVADYYDYTFYVDLNDTVQNLPVVNYIYNTDNYFAENKDEIDATADMLIAFSEMFGVYPFYKEKYGHCITSLGGGMEHQTMTTIGNFGFDLVSHELAHQWFGDYVTCKYWNDIWINEGFASYAEFLAREKIKGIQSAKDWMDYTHAIALSEDDGAIYVPEEEINNSRRIFDSRLSYKKGAAIVHMIRYELANDTLFFNFLKSFLSKYKFETATAEDLRIVLEDISGQSFENFFNQWYYGEGYPIIQYGWYQKGDSLYISLIQKTSKPEVTPFFNIKVQFKLVLPTGDTIVEARMMNQNEIVKFRVPSTVYELHLDPDNYLLKKTLEFGASDSSEAKILPLLLFPNPVKENINIFSRTLHRPIDLEIYNVVGACIKTFNKIDPSSSSLSMRDFEKGIYYFKIDTGSSYAMFKIIKQ